jgi:HEAT repeat protein
MIDSGLAGMRERGSDEGETARAVNRAIEKVSGFLTAQATGSTDYIDMMGQIIFALSPEAQAGLYRSRVGDDAPSQGRVDTLTLEFTDVEAIRLICNVYRGGLRSPAMLARVVRRVIPHQDRLERIAPDLGRALMKAGMDPSTWRVLEEDILWQTLSIGQRVNRMGPRLQSTASDVERIKELASDLAKGESAGDIKTFLKNLLVAFESDDPAVRTVAVDHIAHLHCSIEDLSKWGNLTVFLCQKLVSRLKQEREEGVRHAILACLAAISKGEILKDRFHTPVRTVLTLSKLGCLLEMTESDGSFVSQETIERITAALSNEDETRRNEALTLLKLLGRTVLDSVLSVLEREEDSGTRDRLMMLIGSMGEEVVGDLAHRLTDGRWFVVKTALEVMGEIRHKTVSTDLLLSAVYHDDIRVKREAIKTLGKMESRGSIRILCDLLKEKNEEIQILALAALEEAGDKIAVPHILPLIQKKILKGQRSDRLRKKAIQVLGRLGDSRVLPPLVELLKNRGVFSREDRSVRRTVVETLGALGTPESENLLKSVIREDDDALVLDTARRVLANLRQPETETTV